MIYIASDHGGFEYKRKLKKFLSKSGYMFEDLGNLKYDPKDDYPDFTLKLIKNVLQAPNSNRGILLCRSGSGEAIVANKFKGIRATISWNNKHSKKSRVHNNTNVLVIPSDYISFRKLKSVVTAWLTTDFKNEKRHIRRLNKIKELGQEL